MILTSQEDLYSNKQLLAKHLPIHFLDSASFVPSMSIFQSLLMTSLLTSQSLAPWNKYLTLFGDLNHKTRQSGTHMGRSCDF